MEARTEGIAVLAETFHGVLITLPDDDNGLANNDNLRLDSA
jgi:hypothetical protein